ncbi:T9SS type A sorting domain-containing protein [Flavobacterium paronense]|uniref:T9SS type A sorting domain-containing protein n=1 Tax=Flavobacterium paronense TaxID=1392775 RepID=A0ABV5GBV7_9FLAO|nr:T9SS type A sorting domain-containing protein [Flavobacterium paronense]MDN3677775.1 T9SS type A sorting domain-containing protein [Flavobacterium paronense]
MKNFYTAFIFFVFTTFLQAQVINFPDANFKAKLLLASPNNWTAKNISNAYFKIDSNNDGEIEVSEALEVYYLDVRSNYDGTGPNNITSLIGIEYFTNVYDLDCAFNQISDLDVSSLTNLQIFRCDSNILTNLNISGLTHLISLSYGNNSIPIFHNYLPNLDLSHLINLEELYCGESHLTNLDVSALINLRILICYYNQLTSLDVSGLNNLRTIFCEGNLMEELYLNNFSNQQSFHFGYNSNLKRVFLKAGKTFTYNEMANIDFPQVPNLEYLCVDEANLASFQTKLAGYNYTNCNLNAYCTFSPGGNYYTIQGNSKFDSQNNGCDVSDLNYPNLKLFIASGSNSVNVVSDLNGNYNFPLFNGTHTITPVSETPSYFTISPANFQVTFPTQASPFNQNFCITPNGTHQDVEIWIIPLTAARPGFDARYRILYKNKGNTTVSGSLTFAFDDDHMDFVSAIPTQNNQSYSLLSWNYANLQPFEIRQIEVKLNINSSVEVPAVNVGDVIKFSSTITPLTGDEYTSDNSSDLRQVVVGSIDPNDKTCIEGNVVEPNMIGAYVHYMIRFENTGTYAAENVVVTDLIDLTKFDISSLFPQSSSHPFVTRIKDNKVEFIFENINLPFDDANNDGYITFKIKTKPTLIVGDSFSNNAGIYFDYNFPVVTNTATTTIQALATQDFEFSNYFNLFPNPTNTILNIKAVKDISLKSISVYNTLGQLVLTYPNINQLDAIDVSNLKTGNYFIKLVTDKGITSSKFIKK